jgi:hypothetical protein
MPFTLPVQESTSAEYTSPFKRGRCLDALGVDMGVATQSSTACDPLSLHAPLRPPGHFAHGRLSLPGFNFSSAPSLPSTASTSVLPFLSPVAGATPSAISFPSSTFNMFLSRPTAGHASAVHAGGLVSTPASHTTTRQYSFGSVVGVAAGVTDTCPAAHTGLVGAFPIQASAGSLSCFPSLACPPGDSSVSPAMSSETMIIESGVEDDTEEDERGVTAGRHDDATSIGHYYGHSDVY